MRQASTVAIALSVGMVILLSHAAAQPAPVVSTQDAPAYKLKMPVDEVSLSFHAADAHGLVIDDLKLDELKLLDNNQPPRRIVDYEYQHDLPLRAAIVLDSSQSMQTQLAANRAIAIQYARHLLRRQTDQAFILDFGYVSKIQQSWTSDPDALVAGIRQVVATRENPLGGTALFDTLFRACFNEFGKLDRATSGNFVLLFSDGEDNTSHTSLEEVVDVCQRSNTAIYAFRAGPSPQLFAGGPRTLADLASQTGGRVFPGNASDAEVEAYLRMIEGDLRNQYRLVYNPANLKRDGAFHRIELQTPPRVDVLTIRTGYYDRAR